MNSYTNKKSASGKPQLQKISPYFLDEVARVLEVGDSKYPDCPWYNGLPWADTMGALKRHVAAIEKGEFVDPDTGFSHTAAIASNAMFLFHFTKDPRYSKMNNLPFDGTVGKARLIGPVVIPPLSAGKGVKCKK